MMNANPGSARSKSRRPFRVAEMLREEMATILATEMRDPRLKSPWVTITEIDVSPDLKNAKVYFSTLNSKADVVAMQAALQGAVPFIRTLLARRLEGGYGVPSLSFIHDGLIDGGLKMDRLIDSVVANAPPLIRSDS